MNAIWWAIEFSDGTSGFMKMSEGVCIGVYRADGTKVQPEEKVEYTCIATNVAAPSWA
jgi:hypothetical protein